LKNVTNDVRFSKSEFSASATVVEEQAEGEEGDSNPTQTNEFMVNILKVEGEEKYCIEALQLKGNLSTFKRIFRDLTSHFGSLICEHSEDSD
jgi:hypothetical protein